MKRSTTRLGEEAVIGLRRVLDRCHVLRRDRHWLAAQSKRNDARAVVVTTKGQFALQSAASVAGGAGGGSGGPPFDLWATLLSKSPPSTHRGTATLYFAPLTPQLVQAAAPSYTAMTSAATAAPPVSTDDDQQQPFSLPLLGTDELARPYFVARLPEETFLSLIQQQAPPPSSTTTTTTRCLDARQSLAALSHTEVEVANYAQALSDWHVASRYCGHCGSPTKMCDGGVSRQCVKCQQSTYPRTNPVVIVLVVDASGDRVLLGMSHGRQTKMKLFSVLAGFVDQGENIAQAARREVFEEAGVRLAEGEGAVRFVTSQSWVAGGPCNLMIGCIARAVTDAITMDKGEMTDVRWFTRQELKEAYANGGKAVLPAAAVAAGSSSITEPTLKEYTLPPPSISASGQLLAGWIDGTLLPPSPASPPSSRL